MKKVLTGFKNIDDIISEGIELKKYAIENNDDELLLQMEEIGELIDEMVEELERTIN